MIDWNKEVERLAVSREFLNLESGIHEVLFMDNGEEREVVFDGKSRKKVFFRVRYGGEEKTFTVTKGDTLASLFGQLSLIGRYHGTLEGRKITILVKGEGKNKDYTISEALGLAKQEIEQRREDGNKIQGTKKEQ